MDSIIWTGTNVARVEAFALANNFGFTVGSNHGKFKWYHKLFERLSYPRKDNTVLEIFPDRPKQGLDKFLDENSSENLNYLLQAFLIAGRNDMELNSSGIDKLTELFEVIENERVREYEPWHWTDAKPGDRIFADGSIERSKS